MRLCIGIALFTIVALVNSMSGCAQSISPTASPAKQGPNTELKYDESKDETHAELKPILLSGTDPNKLELDAFAFFRGKTPTGEPHFFGFGVSSESKKEWFDTNRELVFVLDGERFSLGNMVRARRLCKKELRSGCALWDEKLHIFLPYQPLARVVEAAKVEVEIGVRKFTLKDSDLEKLRDFDRRVTLQNMQKD